uniref:SKP1 component POZ domain-containing protein n=1 Tax=Solanum lycopersicum TaxID=4081 RepID=A0A3Q7GUR0_SOLLC
MVILRNTIKHMIDDEYSNTIIPLHNVIRKILVKTFSVEFVKIDQRNLFNLIPIYF